MKNIKLLFTIVLLALTTSVGWSQACTPGTTLHDSGIDLFNFNNGFFADAGWPQFIAEDFIPSGDVTDMTVEWLGGYFPNSLILDNFTIDIYSDGAGLPGALITTFPLGAAVNPVNTGTVAFGADVYSYSVDISSPLLVAGTTYWMAIYNNIPGTSDTWFWLSGPGALSAWSTNNATWMNNGASNLALTITCNTSVVACDVAITNIASTMTCGNDGTITVTAMSSNPPISYSISGPVNQTNATGSFSGLPAGSYTVNVVDAFPGPPACEATGTATVQGDVTPPVIVCPPPVTGLVCGDPIPEALTVADFVAQGGTAVDDCSSIDEMTIFSQLSTVGDFCSNGDPLVATRTYFVLDAAGNIATCTQTISYIETATAPVITSILPTCYKYCGSLANPAETDITYDASCDLGATVTITGPTVIGPENCPGTIYQYTYTVIDDCGSVSQPAFRDYIIGNNGPTIECPPFNLLLECGDPNNQDYIDAHMALATANASCDLGVDITYFPTNINLNVFCNQSTTVTFTATDDCGRTATCTTIVNISDNTPPEITSTYVDGVCNEAVCGSNVSFWFNAWKAKVLEGLSTSDACDSNLSMSVVGPSSANQDCPDGTAETEVNWVFSDNCGNESEISYSFYVVPAEGPAPAGQIMGIVATETAETVENVSVTLDGNNVEETFQTAAAGMYGFAGLELDQNYSVTPYLDQDPLNGVSSFDLVLMAKHILQTQLLDSPYKMIAADINSSGSISTLDLVELRKLILFIDEDFQNNTSWRFIESAFVFPVPTNPFATIFPEVVNINGLTAEEQHDFVGVKIGDVNGSVVANAVAGADDRNVVSDLVFNVADQQLTAGQTYEVAFRADNFDAIHGYQFSLNFDEAVLEFTGLSAGELTDLNESNFGLSLLEEGVITTSWTNQEAQSVARNAEVFHVSFTAKADVLLSEAISVSSRYTKAEAYNSDLDLMDVQFRFDENEVATNDFKLYQNTPNPFKQETIIGFELPEAGSATLNVYDASGKLLTRVERNFAKGYNNISLSNDGLSTGLLYYQLVTPTGTATKKMIVQ